ncbi:tyrosine-type recombinase/integrase [Micromonospora sp. U56]|uniref:tyrosine-type recombinase/integrase n=1 Tax=Micromonospora sp. U56 TaxID=2824900 RepID=UPI001FFD57DA|nr:tyrosine-type recombinase/integrase [Micromonospora sp. U56]
MAIVPAQPFVSLVLRSVAGRPGRCRPEVASRPGPGRRGPLAGRLDQYAGTDRLFVSRDGTPLRGNTLYQAFVRARKKVGLDGLTFHDLRHTGQTLAAQTGATLADLMKRLGHSSMAAARRYLHAVDGRDREIAKALSELAAHGDVARLPRHITMRN